MNANTYLPTESLRPFVKMYRVVESSDELINRIVPDTSLTMVFRFKGSVGSVVSDTNNLFPVSLISGMRKSGRLINYSKDSGNVIVQFKEAGIRAFIREPTHEFYEKSVSLNDLVGYADVSTLEHRLAESKNNMQRVALVEDFLLSKVSDQKQDGLVLSAISRINASRGTVKINDLANMMCISLDAFEKRFRKVAGASPKQFSSIVRMKSIIARMPSYQQLDDLAFEAGYFDRAHFSKDFKLFTGLTPLDFIKSPVHW